MPTQPYMPSSAHRIEQPAPPTEHQVELSETLDETLTGLVRAMHEDVRKDPGQAYRSLSSDHVALLKLAAGRCKDLGLGPDPRRAREMSERIAATVQRERELAAVSNGGRDQTRSLPDAATINAWMAEQADRQTQSEMARGHRMADAPPEGVLDVEG